MRIPAVLLHTGVWMLGCKAVSDADTASLLVSILGDLLMKDASEVKFRASSVGQLLVGGNAISEKQLERLKELETRFSDSVKTGDDGKPLAKPLTAVMRAELDELIAKRDSEFKFGSTAMSYIRDCWLRDMFDYDEPVVTNEILKGLMCEEEAINLLAAHVPGSFRFKNSDSFEDSHFTGTPDIIPDDDWVEDLKCSWSLRTFVETQKPDPIYYAQGQVYLALTGRRYFRLAHVLVQTPEEIVQEERKRFYFRFNCDESNPHYIEAVSKVDRMHNAVKLVPEKDRIKLFEFQRNDAFIANLRSKVELARKVYASMTIGSQYE